VFEAVAVGRTVETIEVQTVWLVEPVRAGHSAHVPSNGSGIGLAARPPALWSGIASGVIWGLWHVPLIVAGGYSAGTPAWYGITCFMISVTAMSIALAWLRLRSRSFWPAALYHGVHNLTIQGIFDGSTIDTGWTKWITTEFGVGLTLASVAMSLYFWRRRGQPGPATPDLPLDRPTGRISRIIR
jgi:hypothetical protein